MLERQITEVYLENKIFLHTFVDFISVLFKTAKGEIVKYWVVVTQKLWSRYISDKTVHAMTNIIAKLYDALKLTTLLFTDYSLEN